MVYYIIACHKEQNGQQVGEDGVYKLVNDNVLQGGRMGECFPLTNSVSPSFYTLIILS